MRGFGRLAIGFSVLLGFSAAQAQPCVIMLFRPDNSVVLNGSAIDLASLPVRLGEIARRKPRPRLCLVAGTGASYAEIEAALTVIGKSGLTVDMTGVTARP